MSAAARELRVMHAITGLGQGGAESQLATLLRAGAPGMGRAVVVSLLPGGAHRAALESSRASRCMTLAWSAGAPVSSRSRDWPA